VAHRLTAHGRGVALCLISAVGFGFMAIFVKQAYAAGISVATLLALRFTLAGLTFWAIVAPRRPSFPARSVILVGLGMGAIGYAAQSALYFGALTHIDASLTALLLYTYPALVFGAALLLGRERGGTRRLGALALSSAGTVLVLVGGAGGAAEPIGIAMGLGAAVAYTLYILVADRIAGRCDPMLLSALVATGGACSFLGFGAVTGSIDLSFDPEGWLWVFAIAGFSTVLAISFFLKGLELVGPATAGILSTLEPVVTVALAMLIFAERLGPLQALGGAAVIAAIVLLQAKVRSSGAPAEAPDPAPACALAREPAGR
jgi:drug/metabolite transporter (DMT)-like permease